MPGWVVHRSDDGHAVSIGSREPRDLPPGLVAKSISDEDLEGFRQGRRRWDPVDRAPVVVVEEAAPVEAPPAAQEDLEAEAAARADGDDAARAFAAEQAAAAAADARAYARQLVEDLRTGAPGALDAFNEFAAALGNDPNFATTILTALEGKQAKHARLDALAGQAQTAFGLGLLGLADHVALRGAAQLGSAATASAADFQAASAVLAALASNGSSQLGRDLLKAADASAARTLLDAAQTGAGGGTAGFSLTHLNLWNDGATNLTLTNLTLAGVEIGPNNRTRVFADLTRATDFRVGGVLQVADARVGAAAVAKIRVDFSLDGGTSWTAPNGGLLKAATAVTDPDMPLFGTATGAAKKGAWTPIAANAKADVLLRAWAYGGDAVIDPVVASLWVQVR